LNLAARAATAMRAAALVCASLAICASGASAASPERIRIGSGPSALDGLLYSPAGPGPHPAVIALHGCGGLTNARGELSARHADWGERLSRQGFAVLFPDSFGSRGLGSQCRVRERDVRASRERIEDAAAALRYLAGRRDIDAKKIALLGWSNGGSSVVYAVQPRHAVRGPDFAAAIAFYPGCTLIERRGTWRTRLPLLVLSGEADDWTPAAPCVAMVRNAARQGDRAEIVTYPGAYHNFDAPGQPVRLQRNLAFTGDGGGSAHSGTNEPARADAIARVSAFLKR
jgi:dienelactone hydrolase